MSKFPTRPVSFPVPARVHSSPRRYLLWGGLTAPSATLSSRSRVVHPGTVSLQVFLLLTRLRIPCLPMVLRHRAQLLPTLRVDYELELPCIRRGLLQHPCCHLPDMELRSHLPPISSYLLFQEPQLHLCCRGVPRLRQIPQKIMVHSSCFMSICRCWHRMQYTSHAPACVDRLPLYTGLSGVLPGSNMRVIVFIAYHNTVNPLYSSADISLTICNLSLSSSATHTHRIRYNISPHLLYM